MSKGTVLVVDDDRPLLDLLAAYLTRLGYEVEACVSGEEALERFQRRPFGYALVVTDVRLPDLGGQDLVLKMADLNGDLRALVSSGIPIGLLQLPAGFSGKVQFLQKPFRVAELARAMEAVLSG